MNRFLSFEYRAWNTIDNEWEMSYRSERAYDDSAHTETFFGMSWNDSIDTWKCFTKQIETSNDAGELIEFEYQRYNDDADDCSVVYVEDYSYDADGNQTLVETYMPDSVGDMYNTYKEVFNYDSAGNLLDCSGFTESETDDDFENDYYSEYSYDDFGNQVLSQSFNWDSDSLEWIGSSKSVNEYDDGNNRTYYAEFSWDNLSSEWMIDEELKTTFDEAVLFSDVVFPEEYVSWHLSNLSNVDQYTSMMLSMSLYEMESEYLQNTEQIELYYSVESNTSVDDLSGGALLQVYPNPATDCITFDVDESFVDGMLEIYSIQGRKVFSQEVQNNLQVNVSDMERGLFLYRLIEGSAISTGKISLK
jgi:hypothetical protein